VTYADRIIRNVPNRATDNTTITRYIKQYIHV